MPDPHRIAGELLAILQNKRYSALMMSVGKTAREFADEAAWTAFRTNAFVGEVTVEELRGPADLYRAYDGVSHHTALTLGSFWCDRAIVESIWRATQNVANQARERAFFDFLRASMFVHPEWNNMKDIAHMHIPAGNTLPVLRGHGNWRALRGTKPLIPNIKSADDVMNQLHWMPIPGPHQYMIPGCSVTMDYRNTPIPILAFNDLWVSKVPKGNVNWPLG